jgi:hypothetical protein
MKITLHFIQRAVATVISSIILVVLLCVAIVSNIFRRERFFSTEKEDSPQNGDDKEEIDSKFFAQKYGFSCEGIFFFFLFI